MKILITGSKGMLAKAVIENLADNELLLTDVEELDITSIEKVDKFVNENRPEYIINCAAYTAVDNAEENEELAEKINALGPKNLAVAVKKYNSTLIHISTDYVFDGELELSKVYTEEDVPVPATAYGRTKLHGEEEIINNCEKYYIFRTAWLYGDGNNFVKTMLKLGNEKDEINVVADQYGSPTYTKDLAKIISQSIDKKIPYGIYHSTNQGFINWYQFAKDIFEIANIDCIVNPVTSEEFIRPAKRPKNSKLSKDKLLKNGIDVPEYKESLRKYINLL